MIRPNRNLAPIALAVLLGACGGGSKETAQGTAGGDILPGSASDAMLPLDTVRSQPPLAPKSESSPGAKAAAKGEPGEAEEPAEAAAEPAEAAPEPEAPAVEEE
jgi:hypothetical protein